MSHAVLLFLSKICYFNFWKQRFGFEIIVCICGCSFYYIHVFCRQRKRFKNRLLLCRFHCNQFFPCILFTGSKIVFSFILIFFFEPFVYYKINKKSVFKYLDILHTVKFSNFDNSYNRICLCYFKSDFCECIFI